MSSLSQTRRSELTNFRWYRMAQGHAEKHASGPPSMHLFWHADVMDDLAICRIAFRLSCG